MILLNFQCRCGKDFSLKPGWSPIRELVTLDGAGTQNMFVTEAKYHATFT